LRIAAPAARAAACDAAKGVLLRAPLKPTQPAELVQIVSPAVSVTVIRVLLKVAFIWTTPFATFFLALRFVVTFAIIQNLTCQLLNRLSSHFLYAFLAGHGLAGAFAGPGVAAGALAANWQPLSVTHTPVTADVAQPRDILCNLPSKLTASYVAAFYNLVNLAQLVFCELARLDIGVNPGLVENIHRIMPAYPVNIGQRNPNRLLIRHIHTNYTRHISSLNHPAPQARGNHPCLCLWRGLLQITRTTPLRLTILQFSQIRLTELLTFIRYFRPGMPGLNGRRF
jgi:hypothetical protein